MILILTRDDLNRQGSEKAVKDVALTDLRDLERPRGSSSLVAEADAVLFVDKGRARVLKSRNTPVPSTVLELGAAVRLVLERPSTGSQPRG